MFWPFGKFVEQPQNVKHCALLDPTMYSHTVVVQWIFVGVHTVLVLTYLWALGPKCKGNNSYALGHMRNVNLKSPEGIHGYEVLYRVMYLS
jgi:hypothetical protein